MGAIYTFRNHLTYVHCQLLPTLANSCQLLPTLANSCQLLPTLTNSCQLLPTSTNSYQLLPILAHSCHYRHMTLSRCMTHCRYITDPNVAELCVHEHGFVISRTYLSMPEYNGFLSMANQTTRATIGWRATDWTVILW